MFLCYGIPRYINILYTRYTDITEYGTSTRGISMFIYFRIFSTGIYDGAIVALYSILFV